MKHTLDEMLGWGACNLEQVKTEFQLGRQYSLRQSSSMVPFNDLIWFLVNKARHDEETARRMLLFVRQLGGQLADGATLTAVVLSLHNLTVAGVRALNNRGIATQPAVDQVQKEQLAVLLPIFDDPDDNVQA